MAEDRCPVCGGRLVVDDQGFRVCESCGLVVDDEPVYHGPSVLLLRAQAKLWEEGRRRRGTYRAATRTGRAAAMPRPPPAVSAAVRRQAALLSGELRVTERDLEEAERIALAAAKLTPRLSMGSALIAAAALVLAKQESTGLRLLVKRAARAAGLEAKEVWRAVAELRRRLGLPAPGLVRRVETAMSLLIPLGGRRGGEAARAAVEMVREALPLLGGRSPSVVAAAAFLEAAARLGVHVKLADAAAAVGASETAVRNVRRIFEELPRGGAARGGRAGARQTLITHLAHGGSGGAG